MQYPIEKVRTIRFQPYKKGMGPKFTLHMYDAHMQDSAGRHGVCFRLVVNGQTLFSAMTPKEAFYGHCSVDGDKAVRGIMGFLTLRPGDTDAEYFESYTPWQRDFAKEHAEALACEVMNRFGED